MLEVKFLEQMKDKYVTIFLVNGIRLQGVIKDFDDKTILLGNNFIYKTAIASIQVQGEK